MKKKYNNINKIIVGGGLVMEIKVGSEWDITDVLWGEGRSAEEIDRLVVIFDRMENKYDK